MIIKWRKSVLRLRSKFIRNAIAMIGVTVMFTACGGSGNTDADDKTNQDSIDQVKEQERLDSIATADSIAAAEKDTVPLEDSIPDQNVGDPIPPVNPLPDDVQTKYGVVPDYNEQDKPLTRYGARGC